MNGGGGSSYAANVESMPGGAGGVNGAHFRIRDYITSLPGILRVSLVVRLET